MKVSVEAYPYACVHGEIDVPDDMEEYKIKQYVFEHWENIEFGEPDLDYAGTDFEIEKGV